MRQLLYNLKEKTDFLDKILIFNITLIPLSLAISIFFADLLASVSSLILMYYFLTKKNINFFKSIKKEIIFFLTFYVIILLSLLLSNYKDVSFLASFFYFRYFLLSLTIFYLLTKYDYYFKIFFFSIFISLGVVICDSIIQQILGFNLFGYPKEGTLQRDSLIYLTSFFGEEKKLGSYLVRFLPLILSLIAFYKPKNSIYFEIIILIFFGSIIFLTSERTALFLLFVIYFFYILISNRKIYFLILISVVFIFLFNFNPDKRLVNKYINFTLKQTGLISLVKKDNSQIIRYYSEEHENLSYTGLVIFKENIFFGSGIKTFFHQCSNIKNKKKIIKTKRNNELVCSTHPHNTYVQILSEIGIFGFFMISFLFVFLFFTNIKILFNNDKNYFLKSYYFINLSLIINLLPLIPSGSFFNNWISLIIFFPLGFWLYIIKKK